ncbi:caspase family protein [Brasilonema sp. CT11]|nr:caspase family protein [Brasilonema sp. CT11]
MSEHNFHRSFAIILGINNYENGIPALETAVPDALKLAQIIQEQHTHLKPQYQAQNKYKVQLLLNQRVTLKKLKQLIEDFKKGQIFLDNEKVTVNNDDRVLFYFAGHGIALEALDNQDGPVGYLIPQDATLKDSTTYLPMQELHDALNALPCRHMLAILDCCFAGAFRWASLKRNIVPKVTVYKERYDRFICDAAWEVITSAADDQEALDSLGQRGKVIDGDEIHSPFAKALFDALRGGADEAADFNEDCIITATELYSYLRDKIEILTENQYKRQTPGFCLLKKHDKGEFIFLLPNFDRDKLANAPPLNLQNNPYRGLQSYDEKDSGLFFGRENLIKQLYQRVVSNKQPFTVVLGASGTGKSSLMKAGLLPRLRQSTEHLLQILDPMRPGESPLKALVQVCLPLANIITAEELAKDEQALANIVERWSQTNPKTKLLLPVDQFEELITLCKSDEEREQFQKLIKNVLAKYPQKVHVVITLRLDFEAQFQTSILKDFWNNARFVVPPMTQDELREAIEKPALEKVVYFDPPSLVDDLINEVVQMPGALPLLSFTLSELYLKYLSDRTRNNRALTKKDYEELGRVVGSLTKRANQEYDQLVQEDPAYKDTIRRVMLRMISLQGAELARRQVAKSELVYRDEKENKRVQTVIKSFSEARLIVEGSNSQGEPYVEPAHDALVRGWDKLLVWKRKNQSTIVLQRLLTPASVDWKNEQSKQFLWNTNPRLNVLKDVLDSNDNWLNTLETEFIQQSIRQRNKDTGSRWGIGITVSIVLSTFIASAITLVTTVFSNLKNKQNVIFASPGQEIQGYTGYKYVYTPDTVKDFPPAVINQIVMGIEKDTPACINVGLLKNGIKSQDRVSFKINAPKKPGVYYVQFTYDFRFDCKDLGSSKGAISEWLSGENTIPPTQPNIGIIIVENRINFSIYKEIWEAYSKNVPSTAVATDDPQKPKGDAYVSLINFQFTNK